jgi:hypothetical protein
MKILFWVMIMFSPVVASAAKKALAKVAKKSAPSKAFPPKSAASGQIEIRGQSRNVSMTLLLNNRSEAIRFVEPRKHYREEILSTPY